MINVNDFKTGLTVEVDGDIFTVLDFQHVKPGKGAAFVRSKLKNLRNGNTVERTFRAGETITARKLKTVVCPISMRAQTSIHSWTTKHTINSIFPVIN